MLQWLLQCSPYLESYCSKSKKILEMLNLLEGFFGVNIGFSLQNLEMPSLLVMLLFINTNLYLQSFYFFFFFFFFQLFDCLQLRNFVFTMSFNIIGCCSHDNQLTYPFVFEEECPT